MLCRDLVDPSQQNLMNRRSLLALREVVDGAVLAGLLRAVRTAKNIVFGLDTVADNSAAAMRADGSQFMYRAFKRIEYMPAPGC